MHTGNPIERFFEATKSGDISAVLAVVDKDAVFEAQGPATVPIYGRFIGHEGVKRFIAALRELFDTEAFEVRKAVEAEGFAFAFGYMQHRLRKTGRVFKSEWALVCEVKGGKILTYKMFEDTAALAAAYA
ncbi:MAG: nuclear transport factor 2 family protein [Steroidobacteraceae bacterium]